MPVQRAGARAKRRAARDPCHGLHRSRWDDHHHEPGAERPPPCPICLARGTMIATPRGEVAVEAIRPGDPVWTLDRSGHRIRAVVDRLIGSMPVPTGHEVVHLILADGRAVLVSPGHPLPDGRPSRPRAGDATTVRCRLRRTAALRRWPDVDLLP